MYVTLCSVVWNPDAKCRNILHQCLTAVGRKTSCDKTSYCHLTVEIESTKQYVKDQVHLFFRVRFIDSKRNIGIYKWSSLKVLSRTRFHGWLSLSDWNLHFARYVIYMICPANSKRNSL